MTRYLLIFIAMLTLGAGVANAASQQNVKAPPQQGENFNWMEGGGG